MNIVAFLVTKHNATKHTEHGENAFWRERGAEYARKLFNGIARHVKREFRPVLITDTPEAVPVGVEYVPHPIPVAEAPGWWSKLAIFKPGLLTGKTLYLDLDNVVCGNLDAMLDLEPAPIIMMQDMNLRGEWPNGSTLLFHPEELGFLWDEYVQNPAAIRREFRKWPKASDQAYIADRVQNVLGVEIPFFQALLPPGYCMNSRVELELGKRPWDKTSLVYGCWVPKPHESTHPFYQEHWR